MVIRGEYEFIKVRNQHRYGDSGSSVVTGHPFSYEKRRHLRTSTKYTAFRPFCTCGWKSDKWWGSKVAAIGEHWRHASTFAPVPRLIERESDE